MYAYRSVGPNLDPDPDFDPQEINSFTNVKGKINILRPPCRTTKLHFLFFGDQFGTGPG
jgi:hypothetical protein